ncbi:MAG: SDR family NAD(P)-dependent oxidoreductase [Kiritimatiellia bacterium]
MSANPEQSKRFENKVALVTGAANGIGRATAFRLACEGASVALLDLDGDKVEQVAAEIRALGSSALAFQVDVTNPEAIQAAVATILAQFKKIDILVNSAGAGWHQGAPFHEMPIGSWQWVLDLNINGTLNVIHAVVNHMIENRYGRIVNLASIAAKTGLPRLSTYAASKGAIVSFTKTLAMELGSHGITVNCVSPGMVSTTEETPPCSGTFLGRKSAPSEQAAAIAFLASDEAAFVTGADYLVDGGRTLGPRGS